MSEDGLDELALAHARACDLILKRMMIHLLRRESRPRDVARSMFDRTNDDLDRGEGQSPDALTELTRKSVQDFFSFFDVLFANLEASRRDGEENPRDPPREG